MITIGFSLSLFSDPFGSQVHSKKNFGKFWVKFEQNNANSGQNFFNKLEVRGPIHMHKCVKVCMEFGVNTKFALGLSVHAHLHLCSVKHGLYIIIVVKMSTVHYAQCIERRTLDLCSGQFSPPCHNNVTSVFVTQLFPSAC